MAKFSAKWHGKPAKSESAGLSQAIAWLAGVRRDIYMGHEVNRQELDQALRVLHELAQQAAAGVHRNPVLGIVSNPPRGALMSSRVYQVKYRHTDDGRDYVHDFGPGVKMVAVSNGDILFTHNQRKPLWEEFPG